MLRELGGRAWDWPQDHRRSSAGAGLPAQGARPVRPTSGGRLRPARAGGAPRPGRRCPRRPRPRTCRRRQRRDGLRDHRVERVRLRRHRSRHRHDAQQLPRRARAQPAGAARPHPGHPARVQHGAIGRPVRGRRRAGHRQPGRRPHHHGADAGAGGYCLEGCRLQEAIDRPRLHVGSSRTARPGRPRGRRHAAGGGATLPSAHPRPRSPGHVQGHRRRPASKAAAGSRRPGGTVPGGRRGRRAGRPRPRPGRWPGATRPIDLPGSRPVPAYHLGPVRRPRRTSDADAGCRTLAVIHDERVADHSAAQSSVPSSAARRRRRRRPVPWVAGVSASWSGTARRDRGRRSDDNRRAAVRRSPAATRRSRSGQPAA